MIARTLQYRAQGGPFLTLLHREADLLLPASNLLCRGVANGAPSTQSVVELLITLERRAEELESTLTSGLRLTPFAPLPQEDLRTLGVVMRRILGSHIALGVKPLDLPPSTEAVICEALDRCAACVGAAIGTLRKGRLLQAHTREIVSHARGARLALRDHDADLVAGELEPVRLMRRLDASRAAHSLFRRYRELAWALECTVLKNG